MTASMLQVLFFLRGGALSVGLVSLNTIIMAVVVALLSLEILYTELDADLLRAARTETGPIVIASL